MNQKWIGYKGLVDTSEFFVYLLLQIRAVTQFGVKLRFKLEDAVLAHSFWSGESQHKRCKCNIAARAANFAGTIGAFVLQLLSVRIHSNSMYVPGVF